MKKNILTLMAAILLCVGLTACGNGSKPFKEYVDYSYEYTKEIIENPDLLKDEGKVKLKIDLDMNYCPMKARSKM